jgi:hypothetical protein
MERFLNVQLDTDYQPIMTRVRASWGGLTSGSIVDVQLNGATATPRWVRCRIERWLGGGLLVSRAS